ncbi:uncharacterized protein LOC123538675 [Mercenaria mercenaria]|uniref:uncharacterized protein LOC123538675 n=1 Tax=Mercenaria mercenaria TaxID=6596 RepID=UPI00234F6A4B|nr:uncharacterized protein LOC123538675 [Mercenaria mercenaria]
MEAEACTNQPKAILQFLAQQVQEQSELCAITVKKGHWEKKFHRCILAASPFFKRAIMGIFLEKKTGVVEIRIDVTAKEIETALLFLYGRTPTINVDNVGGLLELAEFFMIKGLKYECIVWFRAMKINIDTCVGVLQLSNKYNFEVKECTDFIESHLSAVLQHDTATRLTEDLMERFFSDERLSYVTMDEKFRFLLQWICKHPSVTRENIAILFESINVQEVTQSTWETARLNPIFCEILISSNVVRLAGFYRVAMITPSKKGSFCLDLQQNEWYRLKSNIYDSNHLFKDFPVICRNRTEIYFTRSTHNPVSSKVLLTTLNFESEQMNVYEVALKGENTTNTGTTEICVTLMEDKVVANMCKNVSVTRSSNVSVTRSIIQRRSRWHRTHYWKDIPSTDDTYNTSVLYIGHLLDGLIELTPIFSFLNETIEKTCSNGLSSIVLLPHFLKSYVFLFDLLDYKLEKLELSSEKRTMHDKMVQTDGGFLIYNDKRCFCLTRLSGPSLSKKYHVEEHEFENNTSESVRYHYSCGFWIRSRRVKPIRGCFVYSYTFFVGTHNALSFPGSRVLFLYLKE